MRTRSIQSSVRALIVAIVRGFGRDGMRVRHPNRIPPYHDGEGGPGDPTINRAGFWVPTPAYPTYRNP